MFVRYIGVYVCVRTSCYCIALTLILPTPVEHCHLITALCLHCIDDFYHCFVETITYFKRLTKVYNAQ